MHTLTPHVSAYIAGRRNRGEITATTAADLRWTLAGLDASYGDRPLGMLGPAAIDRWLESIGHHAEATRREYLSRVRGFVRWMVATGKLRTDPTAHVPAIRQARRAPRTLTNEQVATLLRTLPNARARAVVWLMVGCGLRCIEVARLRVEDYDPLGRTVTVTGKGGHERTLPVPIRVQAAVNAYLDETRVTAGPLIRNELHPSHGLSAKTLSGYLRGWLTDAGVKTRALDGRSAHALRRTCASDVADKWGDPRLVQAMLGHARLETTVAFYLRRATVDQLRQAMEGRAYHDDDEAQAA